MKLECFLKRNKAVLALFSVLLVAILVFSSTAPALTNSIVNPGWEIYNQISAMQYGTAVKSGASSFPHAYTISGPMWKVDNDAENWGSPTIMVQTSDLRHVDFSGKLVSDETPATAPKTVVRGNHTYILDYHVYMFDVTIRTIADRVQMGTAGIPFGTPIWEHETSWPYESSSWGTPTDHVGTVFNGGTYVKFVISPWRGGTLDQAPTDYTINGAWAGVMNAYIFTKEQGQAANQYNQGMPTFSGPAPVTSRGGLDNGAQVPMFADDGHFGTPAPVASWDTSVTPDTRIASNVVLYLPAQLEAGAYLGTDVLGGTVELTPCDVYVKYTVRVDVLTTHDFVLQTAVNPPDLNPPTDFFSWVYGFWDSPTTQATIYLLMITLLALAFFYVYMKRNRKGEA